MEGVTRGLYMLEGMTAGYICRVGVSKGMIAGSSMRQRGSEGPIYSEKGGMTTISIWSI